MSLCPFPTRKVVTHGGKRRPTEKGKAVTNLKITYGDNVLFEGEVNEFQFVEALSAVSVTGKRPVSEPASVPQHRAKGSAKPLIEALMAKATSSQGGADDSADG